MAPSIFKRAFAFSKALAEFTGSGFARVTKEQYEERLRTCDECPKRTKNQCDECGCYIPAKAQMQTQSCPLDKWKSV